MTTPVASPAPAVASLLRGLVDYAGLFPPAQLGMADAVAAYAAHRRSAEAWMLGRFVVPATRLAELAQAAAPHLPAAGADPWPISVLVGSDPRTESEAIASFADANRGRLAVDALEAKAGTPAEAEEVLAALPDGITVFVEIPLSDEAGPVDPAPLLAVLRAHGACAKVRTGGLSAGAVPAPALLARFLRACADAGVAFKATAGLHHPVRSAHPFTYDPGSARGTMHGFLNVFLAAALLRDGASASESERLLLEERPQAFVVDGNGITWEGHRIEAERLTRARKRFALGFGSCSFEEPVRDLRTLGFL